MTVHGVNSVKNLWLLYETVARCWANAVVTTISGCLDACWLLPLACCSGARCRVASVLVSVALRCGWSGYPCGLPLVYTGLGCWLFSFFSGVSFFLPTFRSRRKRFGCLFCIVIFFSFTVCRSITPRCGRHSFSITDLHLVFVLFFLLLSRPVTSRSPALTHVMIW